MRRCRRSSRRTKLPCGPDSHLAYFVRVLRFAFFDFFFVFFTYDIFSIGTVLCVFLRGAGIVGQRPAQNSDELANPSPENDNVPVDETKRDAADKDKKHNA